MKRILTPALLALFVSSVATTAHAFTFTDVLPTGANSSAATGVYGNTIVGNYTDAMFKTYGFIYDGTTYTNVEYPGANLTMLWGTNGTTHAGIYSAFGPPVAITTDGNSFTTLSAGPGLTQAYDITPSGIVVGSYNIASIDWGFYYNGTTYTTFRHPSNSYNVTAAMAMEGNIIVGNMATTGGAYKSGFIYDLSNSNWTILNHPNAGTGSNQGTEIMGISGNLILGTYYESSGLAHGFLYDGSTWTTIDHPDANQGTKIYGFDGTRIVGSYQNNGTLKGFVTAIPEPGSVILTGIALGAGALFSRRRLRRR